MHQLGCDFFPLVYDQHSYASDTSKHGTNCRHLQLFGPLNQYNTQATSVREQEIALVLVVRFLPYIST